MYLTDVENEIKFNNDSLFNQAVFLLKSTLGKKTYETVEHAARMENLVIKFSRYLNLSKPKETELRFLARLHDIGKIAIPDSILNKPTQLTQKEYEIIKSHSEIGYNIVKKIPFLDNVAKGILHHHERWDGKGYPFGLAGDNIPFIARVITIIDSYDVMTHTRAYKTAMGSLEAIQEIYDQTGQQFDPHLSKVFIKLITNKSNIKKAI